MRYVNWNDFAKPIEQNTEGFQSRIKPIEWKKGVDQFNLTKIILICACVHRDILHGNPPIHLLNGAHRWDSKKKQQKEQ